MAEIRWTPAQNDAIEARGGTLLVSAAAGSGKTAVLTERAVRRLLDDPRPIAADRLLVVTFTRAAAQEMRGRLVAKLSRRVAERPDDPLARRQRRLLDSAVIGTIHALCFELLRQNFQRLGLPAAFRVGDAQELAALRADAVAAALEEGYRAGDAAFLSLVELLSRGRGDEGLSETVLRVLDFARAHPFYRDWMAERLALYSDFGRPSQSVWGGVILGSARQSAACALDECDRALALVASDDALAPYRPALEGDRIFLRGLLRLLDAGDWDGLCAALADFSHLRLAAARRADPASRERVKQSRERVKDAVARLRTRCFPAGEAAFSEDIADLLPKIERLFELVRRVDDLLLDVKLTQGIIDFADLEQLCLELMVERREGGHRRTELAAECAGRFDEIMVDEYQDVNEAQDMLLWALSRGDNLFLVGDVKQSVYRFRQARPELFLDRAASYPVYDGTAFPAQIRLNGNFRSRREVTAAVNQVFGALMSREAGEVDYDEGQALVPMASYPEGTAGAVELRLIDADAANGDTAAAALEAAAVAARVAELLSGETTVTEGGVTRPVEPRDICVLLRSPKSRARLYAGALRDAGIESAVDLQAGLTETAEVAAVLSLLRAVDNPTRDVELAGALLSPLVGLDEDTLAAARVKTPSGGLYAALLAAAGEDAACAAAAALLDGLRRAAAVMTASQLLCAVYERTGFDLVARAMPNGAQRHANLMLLVGCADEWRERGRRGLSAFLEVIDRMAERGEDLAPARASTGQNAVTITSIHRSKGLEWPVVVLADTARIHSFYQNDLIAPTILHSELGFACVRRDPALKMQYPAVPLLAVRLESERALVSEELRVLYVAMTRARERLIVTACLKRPRDKLEGRPAPLPDGRLPPSAVLEGRSAAAWLLDALSQRPDRERLLSGLPGDDGFSLVLDEGSPGARPAGPPKEEPPAPPDEALLTRLAARCAFVYPFEEASRTPAKLAVSRLSHAQRPDERFAARPAFLRDGAMTGAERGRAAHAFMQLCDYERARGDAAGELRRLRDGGWLTARQADAVDLRQIETFFAGALAKRVFAADRVLREFGFMGPATVSPLAAGLVAGGEGTMLQGIADCVIIEGGRAAVIDYKTDRIKTPEALAARYAPQLLIYRDLLGPALGMPVEECVLWSFALGREIKVAEPPADGGPRPA